MKNPPDEKDKAEARIRKRAAVVATLVTLVVAGYVLYAANESRYCGLSFDWSVSIEDQKYIDENNFCIKDILHIEHGPPLCAQGERFACFF